MKQVFVAFLLSIMALGLSVGNAEAARFGGGKSFCMQRQSVSPRPASPTQQAASSAPATPATVPGQAPKRSWLGPIAGLAAGLGIAALFSHLGLGEGMANLLMIGLLVMGGLFVFKRLLRRAALVTPPAEALQYAGVTRSATPSMHNVHPIGSATALTDQTAACIPDGFDAEGFLRVAKLNFVRLQAANDSKNLEDIREFTSPELFAEIKLQMDERGNAPQQTDIVTLNAELLEVLTEGDHHIVSVHFSGMIREVVGTAAEPFGEVWNLRKSTAGDKGWTIAGIQQLN